MPMPPALPAVARSSDPNFTAGQPAPLRVNPTTGRKVGKVAITSPLTHPEQSCSSWTLFAPGPSHSGKETRSGATHRGTACGNARVAQASSS